MTIFEHGAYLLAINNYYIDCVRISKRGSSGFIFDLKWYDDPCWPDFFLPVYIYVGVGDIQEEPSILILHFYIKKSQSFFLSREYSHLYHVSSEHHPPINTALIENWLKQWGV